MRLITVDAREIIMEDRIRKDLGPKEGPESIMGLSESLEKGQIHPVVLDGLSLKAGGRRVAACLLLMARGSYIGKNAPEHIAAKDAYHDNVPKDIPPNMLVPNPRRLPPGMILAVQYSNLTAKEQLEIEVEENQRRKGFNKAEDSFAIQRMQKLIGDVKGLADGVKASVREVAQIAGVSAATVTMGLRVAAAVDANPENKKLLQANSISGAYQSLLGQEALAKKIAQVRASVPTDQLSKGITHGKAEEWMPKITTGSIDLWSLDPHWGIGVDEYDRQQKYDGDWADDRDSSKKLIEFMIPECFRTLKDDSWSFMFFGIQFYEEIVRLCTKVGFKVYPVPYIWYKPNKLGAQNDTSKFDINQYEPILLLAKGDPRLYKQVQGNVLIHNMPPRNERFHFAQKPVELYVDMLERWTFGPMKIADPTAGSLSIVKAAKKLGREYMVCESNKENYDNGIIFINEP